MLNGYIFDGKQIVTENSFIAGYKRGRKVTQGSLTVKKKKNIQRFRDGVKRVALELHLRSLPWNIRIRFIGECRYVLWWKMHYLMTAR